MIDYIKRSDARRAMLRADPNSSYLIDEIPAADVVERASGLAGEIPGVKMREVKRGKWITRRFSENIYGVECSVCHTTWDVPTNYCPYCGCDMREAEHG